MGTGRSGGRERLSKVEICRLLGADSLRLGRSGFLLRHPVARVGNARMRLRQNNQLPNSF